MIRTYARSPRIPLILILMSFSCSCVISKAETLQRALTESQQHLSTGNYQEAINSYDSAYNRFPNETHARENYIRVLEEMKTSAEDAYDAKDYRLSEEIYSVLSKNYSKFTSFEKSLSFDEAYLDRKIKNCRIAEIEIQAKNAVAAGNFSGAINVYKTADSSYPDDALLQAKFLETVSDIYQIADSALTDKNYILAGKIYSFFSNNFQMLKESFSSLPFTENSIKEGLRVCRSTLTGKGLEQYREGKLKEAINIWEGILQFDPDNVEIKKAIENTKAQMKKINKQQG